MRKMRTRSRRLSKVEASQRRRTKMRALRMMRIRSRRSSKVEASQRRMTKTRRSSKVEASQRRIYQAESAQRHGISGSGQQAESLLLNHYVSSQYLRFRINQSISWPGSRSASICSSPLIAQARQSGAMENIRHYLEQEWLAKNSEHTEVRLSKRDMKTVRQNQPEQKNLSD